MNNNILNAFKGMCLNSPIVYSPSCQTFINFRKTNGDIFNKTWEISIPPLKVNFTKMFTLQNVRKEIVKVIHMNVAV